MKKIEILDLEQKCQKGENILENTKKIENMNLILKKIKKVFN